jgi:hypothetical protein
MILNKTGMVKRGLLIITQFWLVIALKAQTVEETKSWILSKLNKYQKESFGIKLKGDCDSYLQSYNYVSSFQLDTLVISFDVKVIYPACFKGDKTKEEREAAKKALVKIPISDISKISSSDNGNRFSIHTKLETIKFNSTFSSGNTESFTDICSIGMNLRTEEQLLERLQKAFNRLVSFYPKKESKETF